jgi:hypothetical protein
MLLYTAKNYLKIQVKIIGVKMIKSGSMPALPQARDFDLHHSDFLL